MAKPVPELLSRLFSLEGKTAIVVGASRGIGFALAQGLTQAGAQVIAIARSPSPERGFEGDIRYVSGEAFAAISSVVKEFTAAKRPVDVLVNAAGITLPADRDAAAQLANFEKTLQANLLSPFACCLAVRPLMPRGGSIINVTSIGSVMGFPDNPGYVAAKGGLRMMTRALAVDYGASGIRVNALAPGYIHTDMTAKSFADPEQNARRRRHTCLDRWGQVEDLVGAAVFLASDASAYMTGQDLFIDGGWTSKGLT